MRWLWIGFKILNGLGISKERLLYYILFIFEVYNSKIYKQIEGKTPNSAFIKLWSAKWIRNKLSLFLQCVAPVREARSFKIAVGLVFTLHSSVSQSVLRLEDFPLPPRAVTHEYRSHTLGSFRKYTRSRRRCRCASLRFLAPQFIHLISGTVCRSEERELCSLATDPTNK